MIRRSLALLPLSLVLISCGQDARPAVEFPTIPPLSPEARAECPPAELITGELGDLATKDAELAIAYARCRAGKAAAVDAYERVRSDLATAAKTAERPR